MRSVAALRNVALALALVASGVAAASGDTLGLVVGLLVQGVALIVGGRARQALAWVVVAISVAAAGAGLVSPGAAWVPSIGRAVALAHLGVATLLLGKRPRCAQATAVGGILVGLLIVLLEVYGVEEDQPFPLAGEGAPGAVGLVALAVAVVFADARHEIARIVLGPHLTGRLYRRILPVVLVTAAGGGGLVVRGVGAGWFGYHEAVAVFVTLMVGCTFVAMWGSGVARIALDAERERHAEQLRSSQARLAEAERVARFGAFDHDLRTNEMSWSPELYAILGVRPLDFRPTLQALQQHVHPDDRPGAAEVRVAALARKKPFVLHHRIVRTDGDIRWVEVHAQLLLDEDGTISRLLGTVHDVTDRVRLDEERRRADALAAESERARQASRAKTEFLANMSHELRTPLNAITGFSEILLDERAGPLTPDQREHLGDIHASARHLMQLLNDVLDLSKIEAGRIQMRPERVDVAQVVDEVAAILRESAIRKRIRVRVAVDPDVGVVEADPRRLKQVLYNYLSNAIKFTPDGGRVDVRARPEGDDAYRIEVQDTGIGIPPQDLDRLFQEFVQIEPIVPGGNGLGLALVRRIVEAQRGRVEVTSTPREGSMFSAVLPRQVTEA